MIDIKLTLASRIDFSMSGPVGEWHALERSVNPKGQITRLLPVVMDRSEQIVGSSTALGSLNPLGYMPLLKGGKGIA